MMFWSATLPESTCNMNKYGQIFSIALALTGASTAVASACCAPVANFCAENISCELHQAVGFIGSADTRSMEIAKTSPATASVETPAVEPPHSGPPQSYVKIITDELAQVTVYLQHLLGI
jgi:hypothetical protein